MNAKKELTDIKKARHEMRAIEEAIMTLESRLTRVTPVLSDMPHGSDGSDAMVDGISDLIDLKKKLSKALQSYSKKLTDATDTISKIADPNLRAILYGVYINGETLDKVSQNLYISYRHVCRLHATALLEYEKMSYHVS